MLIEDTERIVSVAGRFSIKHAPVLYKFVPFLLISLLPSQRIDSHFYLTLLIVDEARNVIFMRDKTAKYAEREDCIAITRLSC